MVAACVDCYVVVVPAQGGEVVWFVAAAMGPRDDVVGLEAVSALTSVNGAAVVPEQDRISDGGWDCPSRC